MTAIFYPDRDATSFDGRFRLEARSPHNGTIPHRDGRPASAEEYEFKYKDHQREFRVQLLTPDGCVVWERWQEPGEDSPHELVVSDDGWSVIRTHGFRPEVIAVEPNALQAVQRPAFYDDADPSLLPIVLNVVLAFVPSVVMAVMHTTTMRANITAYSTAVGPSSRRRKLATERR